MHACRTFTRVCALLIALAGAAVLGSAGLTHAQEQVPIDVGDFWFCAPSFEDGTCETEITAGDTVVWDFSSSLNSHTVTHCGASCDDATSSPLFDSKTVAPGGSYSFTFDDAGTFLYYCEIHPLQMFGRIVAQPAAAEPSPSPIIDGAPAATSTPGAPADGGGLPPAGGGPNGDATPSWWVVASVLAAGGALLALIGATSYRRTR